MNQQDYQKKEAKDNSGILDIFFAKIKSGDQEVIIRIKEGKHQKIGKQICAFVRICFQLTKCGKPGWCENIWEREKSEYEKNMTGKLNYPDLHMGQFSEMYETGC